MVRELQPSDPRTIGQYRLAGRLGQGGMGQVFLGVSAGGRPVAVKAIRAELTSDPQFRSRFAQEVAAARRVNGLFTATVVDADVDGPVPWLATAYVPGPSLAEVIARHGPLPEASLLSLAAGLAESLNAIHVSEVVHRDLKPSNVLLAEDGPRVIDFGISRAAESSALTQPGLVVGSPGFMSPEQAIGAEVGPASDIFSLGAVLAFAATGKGPFGNGTTATLLYRVVHETPDLDLVPMRLRPLLQRCLAKDPAQRPVAAGVVAEVGALHSGRDWLPDSIIRMIVQAAEPAETSPPPRRRWSRPLALGSVAGGVALATGAAVFALVYTSTGHAPGPGGSQPAAQTLPARSGPGSVLGGSPSPTPRHPATSPASATPVSGPIQQAGTPPPASSAHSLTSPAAPASHSASGSPTASKRSSGPPSSSGSPPTSPTGSQSGSPSQSPTTPASTPTSPYTP